MFRKLAWKKPQQVKGTKIVVGGERDGINRKGVIIHRFWVRAEADSYNKQALTSQNDLSFLFKIYYYSLEFLIFSSKNKIYVTYMY